MDASTLAGATTPIPAMRLETPGGARVRLTYGDDGSPGASAVGFDRSTLDAALLALAAREGADVRPDVTVTGGDLSDGPGLAVRGPELDLRGPELELRGPELDLRGPALALRGQGGTTRLRTRVVVGADGVRSTVTRLAGVARPGRLGERIGLTFHVDDPRWPGRRVDARMVVLDEAYCGLAPVPGGRLNVGIVLSGRRWRRALATAGAASVVAQVLRAIPATDDDPVRWADVARLDAIVGVTPLGHRVSRRSGRAWLLAGDAAGFLDPFTGEGIHRACVSAELAAAAVHGRLRGRSRAMDAYDREVRRRFATKDAVTLLVQAFLARPALFEYAARRLARRAGVRETMSLVMGDLVPASRALDPRFLAALLAP
jgi:flavin-dependent dehydrogenase